MSVTLLAEKFAAAKKNGRLPKVVIPVHFAGQSCDMAEIRAIAHEYGAKVIEDASHAVGGTYRNGHVGGCEYADITIFSFHPVKIITTGEGGMALTNDDALARRMADLRSHGITRDAARMTTADEGAWYYEQHELGFNYRMTEMQAALGLSQLGHLADWIARRGAIARAYDAALAGVAPGTAQGRAGAEFRLASLRRAARRRGAADAPRILRRDAGERRRRQRALHPDPWQPDFQRLGFARASSPRPNAITSARCRCRCTRDLTDAQFE